MLLVVAALAVAAVWPGALSVSAQQPGVVMGAIPNSGGIGLVAWDGTIDGLRASARVEGCQLDSVWATVGGRFIGYTFGRPAFVNEGFTNEVGTTLRSDQVLLVVCSPVSRAVPPASPPTVAPPPSGTPSPTATPAAPTPVSPGSPAPPFSTTPLYDPAGPDVDCSDFPTQADAQIFFEAAGGPSMDRHRLDADGNGLACEDLP